MAASSQNVVNTGSWWLVRQFNSRRTKTQVGFEPARKHNRLIIPFYPEDGTLATMATLARLPAGERMSIDATTLHDRTGAKLLRLAGVGGDNVIKLGDKVVMYHRDCVVVGTVTTATGSIIKHDDLRREEPDSVELWNYVKSDIYAFVTREVSWEAQFSRSLLTNQNSLIKIVFWLTRLGTSHASRLLVGELTAAAATATATAATAAAAAAAETPNRRRRRADAPSSTAAVPPQQDAAVAAETPSRRSRRADARSSAAAAAAAAPDDTPPPRKRDRPTTRASRAAADDEAFDAADAAQTLGECTVCLDRTARVAMVPCGHVVLCAQCCRALREKGDLEKCCICRQEVENTVAIRL